MVRQDGASPHLAQTALGVGLFPSYINVLVLFFVALVFGSIAWLIYSNPDVIRSSMEYIISALGPGPR